MLPPAGCPPLSLAFPPGETTAGTTTTVGTGPETTTGVGIGPGWVFVTIPPPIPGGAGGISIANGVEGTARSSTSSTLPRGWKPITRSSRPGAAGARSSVARQHTPTTGMIQTIHLYPVLCTRGCGIIVTLPVQDSVVKHLVKPVAFGYTNLCRATSPSGKARVCKTLIVGSIPTVAFQKRQNAGPLDWRLVI